MISIIIPVYNGEQHIEKCVKSILDSIYTNIQIIIVNDGSIDNTCDICNNLEQCYQSITVIHQPQNSGTSKAKNIALRHANGQFVFFMDADDIIPPSALLTLHKYAHKADLTCGNFKVYKNKEIVDFIPWFTTYTYCDRIGLIQEIWEYISCPRGNHAISYGWGKLYDLDIINKYNIRFNEQSSRYEDGIFNLDYILHSQSCIYTPEIIYEYHTTESNYGYTIQNYLTVLNKMEQFLIETNSNDINGIMLKSYKYFLNRHIWIKNR